MIPAGEKIDHEREGGITQITLGMSGLDSALGCCLVRHGWRQSGRTIGAGDGDDRNLDRDWRLVLMSRSVAVKVY